MSPTATTVQTALRQLADPVRAKASPNYFKTGEGQYGAGDIFIGITVPNLRRVAKQFRDLPLAEAEKLLLSPIHEDRETALFILVYQYERATPAISQQIFEFYLDHTECINNWDLVDASAWCIVGPHLAADTTGLLDRLARSNSLWERRIAIVATAYRIRQYEFADTLRVATMLLADPHDLIHKAVGWMLREVGKRDVETLRAYLAEHYAKLPRTTLRYAIERFDAPVRARYLKGDFS